MAIKLFQFEQCDQNGRFLNGLAKKFLHKIKFQYVRTAGISIFSVIIKDKDLILSFFIEIIKN